MSKAKPRGRNGGRKRITDPEKKSVQVFFWTKKSNVTNVGGMIKARKIAKDGLESAVNTDKEKN